MAKKFVNPAFESIFDGITSQMPIITFAGIIGTYVITAGLTTYFIPLPLYLSIPAAVAIQFGRFAVVFMDFLNPTGHRSFWPPMIATTATIVASIELAFSILHLEFSDNKFWAVFLFGWMVIVFGYILELQFISKGAEAFGMTRRPATQGAASAMAPAESTPAPTPRREAPREESPAPLFDLEELMSSNGNGNGKHH